MSASFASILYLVAGVLFILALRGLSHPTTSREGNRFGMIGMAIAVLTTLVRGERLRASPAGCSSSSASPSAAASAPRSRGASPMTAMPQLVAAFHSLVGLAAVLVAAGALNAPAAFGIARGRAYPCAKR